MSKNRLTSSNNAINVLDNGKIVTLSPKLNFEGNVVSVVEDLNGVATIKLDVPDREITQDLMPIMVTNLQAVLLLHLIIAIQI